MKRVIFVGGTSFSGSTFFMMTLGNDPHGFAGGEIRLLFHPGKEFQVNENWTCGCDDLDCRLWDKVLKNGESHLYETIFDECPEVNFIVDSSKNVLWASEHSERLAKRGIEAHNIVIWKSTMEFAASLKKRGRLSALHHWTRYHQFYASVMPEWRAVAYRCYTREQDAVLQAVCDYTGIPMFPGKERFWEKSHHVLGGNPSARVHLYAGESERFADTLGRARDPNAMLASMDSKYQKIYYEPPADPELEAAVAELRSQQPITTQLEAMLKAYDVQGPPPEREAWSEVFLDQSPIRAKILKQRLRETVNGLRWRRK
jgi:hypothetical protein